MTHLTADPFAAMVDPGLFARAVAESLQLSLLPKRQYSPLSEPSRPGSPDASEIDDDAGQRRRGTQGVMTDAATVAGLPLHGSWHGGADDADRFDFVDTGPGGLIAVDPVQRVG